MSECEQLHHGACDGKNCNCDCHEDLCDICGKMIHRGGVINWKTGFRGHVSCARKAGAYND